MTVVRAVVGQVRAPCDTGAALACVAECASRAARENVELVVFPEALVGGYLQGAGFGAVIRDRSEVGRTEFLVYSLGAVEIPGPEVDQLAEIAREHGLHLVGGLIERAGSTLYCAAVIIDDTGQMVGRRRKVMSMGSERLVWGHRDGSTLRVSPTRLGRLASVVCWENLMPALRLAFYAQGVDTRCAPTAYARDVQLAAKRHIAVECHCFVTAANQVAQAKDLPPTYATGYDDPRDVVCRGTSVIVDPFGTVVAGPLADEEGLLAAHLDLDDVTRGHFELDAAGHYSRPDVFTLTVDTRVRPVVDLVAGNDPARDAVTAEGAG